MRRAIDRARLADFSKALAQAAKAPGRVYLTGGATALLLGWRETTRDEIRARFEEIEPLLYRFPAIDPRSFRKAIERATAADEPPC